ncbi:hypothetical protein MUG91_G47n95 [Manis pentadactyla]|nr:hypothetical protein MUG91_G47n95 [Manis pentadactyla]
MDADVRHPGATLLPVHRNSASGHDERLHPMRQPSHFPKKVKIFVSPGLLAPFLVLSLDFGNISVAESPKGLKTEPQPGFYFPIVQYVAWKKCPANDSTVT